MDDDQVYQSDFYTFFRLDRLNKRGGGVIVYLKKNIQVIDVLMSSDFESIELSLSIDDKKIFLIACYRPPSCEADSFLDYLTDKVSINKSKFDEVIVAGDLNFDMLSESQNELHDVCDNLGLSNTVKKGTRFNDKSSSSTLLDVILSL